MASNNPSDTRRRHGPEQTPQAMEGYGAQGRESVIVRAGGNQSDTPVSTRTLQTFVEDSPLMPSGLTQGGSSAHSTPSPLPPRDPRRSSSISLSSPMGGRVEGISGDVFTEPGAPPIDTPIGGPQMTYPDLTSTGMRIPPTIEQDPYGTQFAPLTEGELAIMTALTRRYRASLLVKPSGQEPRTPAHSPLSEQLTGESAHAGSEETV